MPDGRTHRAINILGSAVVFGVTWLTYGLHFAIITATAYLVGELWLSPDLDHRAGSDAYKRWWILAGIWLPYQAMHAHRRWLSHAPILGTLGRLVYLSWLVGAALLVMWWIGYRMPDIEPFWREGIAVLVGVELAAITHWIADWW